MKKRTERFKKSLKQERVTLHTLIDNLPDGIFLKDRESRFIFANQVIAELMGAPDPSVLTGKTDHDFYSKEVADALRAEEQVLIGTRQGSVNKEESKSLTAGLRRILTTKVPVVDTHGKVTGLLGITRDITERHEVEEKLRVSEQRYRDLLEQAADGIFLLDENGKFLMVNTEICEMLGYTRDELLQLNILDTYPNELREVGKARFDAIKAGEKMRFERTMKRKDGSVFPIEMSARRLSDGTMQGIAHDIAERKRAESELALERSLLRALMENIPDHIYFKDAESCFIRLSRSLARTFGLGDATEAIGKTDGDFFSEEHARKAYEDEQRIILTGEPILEVEEKETWPNRPDTWVLTTKMPLRDQEGNITGTFGISRDVSERKRAEQALSQERAFLTALMDNIPDYIYFKDRESRFILNNRAHAQALGASSPSEMLGKTDFDYLGRDHAQKAFDDEQRIIRTGQPLVDDIEGQTLPNQPLTWVSATKMPLRDEKGEIIGTFGVSRDMTERRQMEEKNLRLAAMVESSNDAIIGIGLDDTVMSWNKGAEKVFGYTAEEMIERPITTLLSPNVQDQELALEEKLAREGHAQHLESTVTRKDGTLVYVSTSFSPIRDANGLIVGIASISRDVTAQRALQVEVIRSQRLESLATLAAGIAHQFNNINTATKGYLDIVAQDTTLPAPTQSYVKEALKAVHRAVEITKRLQGLTSAASTGAETLRLEEAVTTFLPLFDEKLQEDDISIQVDFHETPPVRVGRTMLSFIVTSLLTNAIHALLDCPSRLITLRTRNAPGFSSLEVSDTGCGILPENLPRIFTPFFTTKGEWAEPKSPQFRVKGIGLSLAVCQSTVAESGGRIEVESVPHQGSTFRVWFPATPAMSRERNQNAK